MTHKLQFFALYALFQIDFSYASCFSIHVVLGVLTLLDVCVCFTSGEAYCGLILTAVCILEVVAPPISNGSFDPALDISWRGKKKNGTIK